MTPASPLPMRLLLADDDPTFRETTADLLRGDGFLVDTAQDGGEAVDLLRANAYDLLLSDILMPGNSELDLVRCIHELDPDLPVILVTGYPSVDTAVASVHLCVKAYLTKPLDYGALLAELQRIRKGLEARRALRANQDRLLEWVDDMDQIQRLIRESRALPNRATARHVLALSLGNIAGVLLDMRTLFELTLDAESDQEICGIQRCPRLEALEQGLDTTIAVLEKTKQSFKSKELAALRTDLERLRHPPFPPGDQNHLAVSSKTT